MAPRGPQLLQEVVHGGGEGWTVGEEEEEQAGDEGEGCEHEQERFVAAALALLLAVVQQQARPMGVHHVSSVE
jgi:hypothetical protein